eukprot:422779-Pelagomonas_calceolata.AAC.5
METCKCMVYLHTGLARPRYACHGEQRLFLPLLSTCCHHGMPGRSRGEMSCAMLFAFVVAKSALAVAVQAWLLCFYCPSCIGLGMAGASKGQQPLPASKAPPPAIPSDPRQMEIVQKHLEFVQQQQQQHKQPPCLDKYASGSSTASEGHHDVLRPNASAVAQAGAQEPQ